MQWRVFVMDQSNLFLESDADSSDQFGKPPQEVAMQQLS